MKDYSKEIIPMYENKEDQEAFNEIYNTFHNFIKLATEYFENAGVDIDEEELIDCLEVGVYPFEEFQNGMPPADKLKYGGDFLQDPENKVFYLNINYANLADRLKAYQLLDRFGINFYPVHIIDNRHLRSYYIPNAPDKEVQDLIDRIKAKHIPKKFNSKMTENYDYPITDYNVIPDTLRELIYCKNNFWFCYAGLDENDENELQNYRSTLEKGSRSEFLKNHEAQTFYSLKGKTISETKDFKDVQAIHDIIPEATCEDIFKMDNKKAYISNQFSGYI